MVVLAALVYVAVLAVIQIYPHQLPTTKNPSFVDSIFDSRIVILVVRVALMFAAGYIVISVVGLIVGRRWLSKLGPFKHRPQSPGSTTALRCSKLNSKTPSRLSAV